MKIIIMSGQFQMILSWTLDITICVLGGGHIILPNFDVGHHPDEQPMRKPAFNVLVISVVCLSNESSSPAPLVSIRAVHYNGRNWKSPIISRKYLTCRKISKLRW